MQNYATSAGRINEIKGEILGHAQATEVLALGCKMKPMPGNKGTKTIYRRWLPYGATSSTANTQNRPAAVAAAHLLTEGVTPSADTLTAVDVEVTIQQYGALYAYSDKTAELHEDDIPEEMVIQTAERMGLVREMIRYGVMKACTNVVYAGGTSRGTVDEAISIPTLRRMTRTLKSNHAKKKTRILSSSAAYNTYAVQAGYIVFVHTDAQGDIEDLPGYIAVADYGSRQPISEHEIGTAGEYRFILSPELAPYTDSGATAAGTGLETSGTSVDVYPFIVMGEDAVWDVALRGLNSVDPTHIPANKKEKTDPLGQRGYVGASFWAAAMVVNHGWMGVIEAGVSDI